ncbi:hypothetical protein HDU88_007969 [Geranomyces variabilis]|nr:hypothetical protein HDU88_007969 [Geranomyces variabilis]
MHDSHTIAPDSASSALTATEEEDVFRLYHYGAIAHTIAQSMLTSSNVERRGDSADRDVFLRVKGFVGPIATHFECFTICPEASERAPATLIFLQERFASGVSLIKHANNTLYAFDTNGDWEDQCDLITWLFASLDMLVELMDFLIEGRHLNVRMSSSSGILKNQ